MKLYKYPLRKVNGDQRVDSKGRIHRALHIGTEPGDSPGSERLVIWVEEDIHDPREKHDPLIVRLVWTGQDCPSDDHDLCYVGTATTNELGERIVWHAYTST